MKKKKSRPFLAILLILMVLFFTALNLARAIEAVRLWKLLTVVLLVHPAYLVASGAVWTLVGLSLALGLWLGWAGARRWTLPVMLAYSLYAWFDRLALPGYADRNQNWLFMGLVNLLAFGLAAWVLSRRSVKTFFGDAHEQLISGQSAAAGRYEPGDLPARPAE